MLNFDKTDLRDGILYIDSEDGTKCIYEEGATETEKAMFAEFRAKYPDGKPQPQIDTPMMNDPVDQGSMDMAEAIISLTMEVEILKANAGLS